MMVLRYKALHDPVKIGDEFTDPWHGLMIVREIGVYGLLVYCYAPYSICHDILRTELVCNVRSAVNEHVGNEIDRLMKLKGIKWK